MNQPKSEERTGYPPSRVQCLLGVQILAVGSFAPDDRVTNEQMRSLGVDPDWILQRTGIRERRQAPPEMATSDMAIAAAQQCLARSGVSPDAIDLVIVGTFTPDLLAPSTACLVQDRLGLNAGAMDLQSACAGFVYALVTGMQYVATGCSKYALVIGADCNTRVVDRDDVKIFPLFGDGAGAVLLGRGSAEQGLVSYTLGSDGAGAELLYRPMGGTRTALTAEGLAQNQHMLQMDGRAVFKWAIRVLEHTTNDVLRHAGLMASDIDLVVLHQANLRIINAAVEVLGIDPAKVFNNLEKYGNTSAASIPLALDEAAQQGRVRRGQNILMSGYGAGLSWGTAIVRW
jgi:3-oxoacyl-[acyl-carrier-protein] synthase III